MGSKRLCAIRAKLLGLCGAAMLFQTTQCGLNTEQLLPQLVTNIAGIFVSSWVNDWFNVTGSPF